MHEVARRVVSLSLASVAVLTGAGSALAGSPPGATAVAARQALAAGRAGQALALFKRAALEEPARAELWCGVGLAHERLGALPQAHAFLTRCLAASAPAGAEAALRRVTRALGDGRYAPVSIDVRPEAELRISPFAADEVLTAPIDLWLPFGTHAFTLASPGHEEHRGDVVVDSISRQIVSVVLRRSGSARGHPAAIDFGDGADGPSVDAPITAPDQRPLRHESLLPERFRGPREESGKRSRPAARSRLPAPALLRALFWQI